MTCPRCGKPTGGNMPAWLASAAVPALCPACSPQAEARPPRDTGQPGQPLDEHHEDTGAVFERLLQSVGRK